MLVNPILIGVAAVARGAVVADVVAGDVAGATGVDA